MNALLANRRIRAITIICAIAFLLVQVYNYRSLNADLDSSITLTQDQVTRISQRLNGTASDSRSTLNENVPWKSDSASSAEQLLQNWALSALQRHEQTVRQYLLVSQVQGVDAQTIGLRLEFSGALSGLVAFIAEVETHRPALGISNLQIRPLPQREQKAGSTLVAAQIVIWGVTNDFGG